MPLQTDASHPEADTVGVPLGLQKICILARGRMALCAVSNQFVVPLEPPPPLKQGPSRGPTKTTKISDHI